ncbi:hypothetical protein ACGWY9_000151 [Enterococcus hirae]
MIYENQGKFIRVSFEVIRANVVTTNFDQLSKQVDQLAKYKNKEEI